MSHPANFVRSQAEPIILKFDPGHRRIDKTRSDEQTLGQFIPLVYHYNMLQDSDRVGAFRAAIELLVQPGMRVAELGSGTGILSSFAARRGAKVDAVERNPELVKCSRQLIQSNGLQKQINVIAEDASLWTPTEPIDVVICEMLHVGLLREKQAQVITAIRQ
jgi:predicted RNA methylase